jgi:4-oxalocrotonate tautomerase
MNQSRLSRPSHLGSHIARTGSLNAFLFGIVKGKDPTHCIVLSANSHETRFASGYLRVRNLKKGGLLMPLVQVKVIEGIFSDAQKRAMIEKVTDAMVSIEGENMRQVTWVTIEDVKSGEWGIGGKALTTEAVKALAAGK